MKTYLLGSTDAAQRELAAYGAVPQLQGSIVPVLVDAGWSDAGFVIVLSRAPGMHPHQMDHHLTERQLINALQVECR